MSPGDRPDAVWPLALPPAAVRQPDRYSCGATVVVLARMLADPAYAERLSTGGLAREVLATHRRLTGWRGSGGRLQVPWPRRLGTPPWAVAGAVGPARRARVRVVRWRRRAAFAALRDAVGRGPVAVYVGQRWLPRHVVLALGLVEGGVVVHEPSRGALLVLDEEAFVSCRLGVAGWSSPWFVVVGSGTGA